MSDLEILLAEGQRISPDPVDMFEDRLASNLGLERGLALAIRRGVSAEWRSSTRSLTRRWP